MKTFRWHVIAAAVLGLVAAFSAGCGHPPVSEGDDAGSSTDFDKLYTRNCAGCHGVDGAHGPGPRISDPLYLAFAKRDDIRNVLEHGRKGTPMPAFGPSESGPLTGQQIDAVVDGMERKWAKPVNTSVPIPPYSEEASIAAGLQPGDAARGQKLYLLYCAGCHGLGKGPSAVGAIATASYLAIASNQGLRTTIVLGRPDFPVKKLVMADWAHRPPRPIANQEISDVVAWLASQRPTYSKVKPPAIVPTRLEEPHP